MEINDLTRSKKTILPVNRVLFPNEEQQKRFIFIVLLVSIVMIIHFWIIDIYQYTTDNLEMDGPFWFRQITALLVIGHLGLYFRKKYSLILFSIAFIMNTSIIYLALFTSFFPVNSFVLLTLAPTLFVAVFYERKFSLWYISITCLVILAGYLILADLSQIWNAILVVFSFLMILFASFLQNPSIQLMKKAQEIWETQYVRMLKLVYDGVLICEEYRIIDADINFYELFKFPKNTRELFLKDILAKEAQQYVYDAISRKDTEVITTLGRRQDGIVFPITLYVLQQIL
ncbi:MAG: hypothetical protein JEZ00_20145, partial [Anaerolineaceae bacterium]|nr:hypothetical protein [Anaerolineaceae bacterium]